MVVCVALLGSWTAVVAHFGATPAEDAFILFRYADHWASGHGIVWNIGEKPVEGATDFLWLAFVTLTTRLTHDPPTAAFLLSAVSIAATVWLSWFVCWRKLQLPAIACAIWIVSYFATPAVIHLVNGFSAPMFAFLLTLETSCLVLFSLGGGQGALAWALSASMLLVGLTRPEGNAFNAAVLMIFVFVARKTQNRGWWKVAAPALLVYVLPGTIYFLLRWSYFGLPWPLPFLVKGLAHGGRLNTLLLNLIDLLTKQGMTLALLAIALLWRSGPHQEDRALAISAIPAGLLLATYLPFVQSQNVANRFQYSPLVPVLAIVALRIGFQVRRHELRKALRSTTLLAVATAWATVVVVPIPEPKMDTIPLGQALRPFAGEGYTLATTEAGRLPYFSTWWTLDSYGLNDPTVATKGLSYEYWEKHAPDLVLIHPSQGWNPYKDAIPPVNDGNRRELMRYMRRDRTYRLVAMVRRRGRLRRIHMDDYDLYFLSTRCREWKVLERTIGSIPGAVYAPRSSVIEAYLSGA